MVRLGNQSPPRPQTLTFHSTLSSVVVDTGCRTLTFEYGLDTDGNALSFREVESGGSQCSGDGAEWDRLVTEALTDAHAWAVDAPTAIRVIGRSGVDIRLDKIP